MFTVRLILSWHIFREEKSKAIPILISNDLILSFVFIFSGHLVDWKCETWFRIKSYFCQHEDFYYQCWVGSKLRIMIYQFNIQFEGPNQDF